MAPIPYRSWNSLRGRRPLPRRRWPLGGRLFVEALEERVLLSGTPPAQYAEALYDHVLRRPADGGGRDHWAGAMGGGGMACVGGAEEFVNSSERHAAVVAGLYRGGLGRGADAGGLAYWTGELDRGRAVEQVAADLLGSDENAARSGASDELFVRGLYRDLLGRPADEVGLAYWLERLGSQSRRQVSLEFVTGDESRGLVVTRWYQDYLGRLPDAGGLTYWVGRWARGARPEALQAEILASDEFQSAHVFPGLAVPVWPGVMAAIVLGFSRAFGETMAVLMVVGNVAEVPHSIFDPAYPLPALIANNYGEMMSIPLYDAALMGAALILLLIVLAFNMAARLVLVRWIQSE